MSLACACGISGADADSLCLCLCVQFNRAGFRNLAQALYTTLLLFEALFDAACCIYAVFPKQDAEAGSG